MNQSRVGVFCLRAKILGKPEGNKDSLALAKPCVQTLPVIGGVVGLKLAKFTPSSNLLFPCLVHIFLSYINCVCGIDTLFKKNVHNVYLLVFIIYTSTGYILCMSCNFLAGFADKALVGINQNKSSQSFICGFRPLRLDSAKFLFYIKYVCVPWVDTFISLLHVPDWRTSRIFAQIFA